MIVDFEGITVRIPHGFRRVCDESFVDLSGNEYILSVIDRAGARVICLEPVTNVYAPLIELQEPPLMKKIDVMDVRRLRVSEAALDAFANNVCSAYVTSEGLYYFNGFSLGKGPLSEYGFVRFLERLATKGEEAQS